MVQYRVGSESASQPLRGADRAIRAIKPATWQRSEDPTSKLSYKYSIHVEGGTVITMFCIVLVDNWYQDNTSNEPDDEA